MVNGPPPARRDRARLTVLVSGQVQGVGFRAFVRRQALDLGLAGYVENLGDGRVEVVAEGDREELEHLLHLLRQGPAHAVVDDIQATWAEAGDLTDFFVY